MDSERITLLNMLAERLERLNVDSKWARRASGTRGSIIKALSMNNEGSPPSPDDLDILIRKSMDILSKAAGEIPDLDELRKKYR
jgi:hypothetical protein